MPFYFQRSPGPTFKNVPIMCETFTRLHFKLLNNIKSAIQFSKFQQRGPCNHILTLVKTSLTYCKMMVFNVRCSWRGGTSKHRGEVRMERRHRMNKPTKNTTIINKPFHRQSVMTVTRRKQREIRETERQSFSLY